MNCPLCGTVVLYAGLTSVECQGPGCKNNRDTVVAAENQVLSESDPACLARLRTVERARLLHGNWAVAPAPER